MRATRSPSTPPAPKVAPESAWSICSCIQSGRAPPPAPPAPPPPPRGAGAGPGPPHRHEKGGGGVAFPPPLQNPAREKRNPDPPADPRRGRQPHRAELGIEMQGARKPQAAQNAERAGEQHAQGGVLERSARVAQRIEREIGRASCRERV